MKVSELSGALLDYWVAKCEGAYPRIAEFTDGKTYCLLPGAQVGENHWRNDTKYSPSTDWAHGGPLMERNLIGFTTGFSEGEWCAAVELTAETYYDGGVLGGRHMQSGPTPLVAAMRCYVASRFGGEVADA